MKQEQIRRVLRQGPDFPPGLYTVYLYTACQYIMLFTDNSIKKIKKYIMQQ